MLVAQGADLKAFNQKLALDSTAKVVVAVKSGKTCYVYRCDARVIGEVIRDLGGGRLTKDSLINYDVGVDQIAKPAERVEKSATLCRIHAADPAQAKAASARLKTAFAVSEKRRKPSPLISEIIAAG
jgi:thymidine phosphorylase